MSQNLKEKKSCHENERSPIGEKLNLLTHENFRYMLLIFVKRFSRICSSQNFLTLDPIFGYFCGGIGLKQLACPKHRKNVTPCREGVVT